ncbi:hypothetical protein AAG906_007058 [Vitis piasezkii]
MTPNSFPHLPGPIRPLTIHHRTVMITSSTSHPSQGFYLRWERIYKRGEELAPKPSWMLQWMSSTHSKQSHRNPKPMEFSTLPRP